MHSSKPAARKRNVLSQDQLGEIQEAFTLFDSESKGALDARELKAAVRAMGFDVKKEQVRKMMLEVGKETNQLVNLTDFTEMLRPRMHEKGSREELMKIFQLFDDNRSGKITLRDLKRVATEIGESITEDELKEMLGEADRDGDGALNFDEFYRVMRYRNDDPVGYWSDSE
jgi:centrin-1